MTHTKHRVITFRLMCLALGAAFVLLVSPTNALARNQMIDQQPLIDTMARSVTEASQRFGIPENWIYAVIHVESAGHPNARSRAGAQGLMQLMPATWAKLRQLHGLGGDVFDVHDNISAGTAYLRELYERYGAFGMLAAYNAGAGRYEAYRDHSRALPPETRNYVARLAPALTDGVPLISTPLLTSYAHVRPFWTQGSLFIARQTDTINVPPIDRQSANKMHSTDRQTAFIAPNEGLFVHISDQMAQ